MSDLQDNFAEISKTVRETAQPVFLTEGGYGSMVVLSMEAFQNMQFENEVYFKLREAQHEAAHTNLRHSSEDVFAAMTEAIRG
jgi:PHD/YefM family antitoxin component YafN of YafNO toxin-antitoxin module